MYLPPHGASGTTRSIAPAARVLAEHRQDPEQPIRSRHLAAANPGSAKPDQFPRSAPRAAATTPPRRFARQLDQKSPAYPLKRKIHPHANAPRAPIAKSKFFPNRTGHKFRSDSRAAIRP